MSTTISAHPPRGRMRRRLLALASGLALGLSGLLTAAGPAAATTAAGTAYVVNYNASSVSVVDTATGAITATIPVASSPDAIALSLDGTRAYVGGGNSVSVIDTASKTVIATIATSSIITSVAVTPDGSKVYVNDAGSPSMQVIDTATNTVSGTIFLHLAAPQAVAISPDGAHGYVATGDLEEFDTATNTVTASVPVSGPDLRFSPDGSHLYVADFNHAVDVVDTATNTVAASVPLAAFPSALAIAPDGAHLYVTEGIGQVEVLDTATDTISTTIAVPAPFRMAISPDGSFAYITNASNDTVSVLDLASNTLTATLTGFSRPWAVAFAPAHAAPPTVTGISPAVGSQTGGTVVTITGSGFTAATAVHFGTTPASAFTVVSDTRITATAPAGTALGPVDVTITTPAGTSATGAADTYSYVNETAKVTADGRLNVGGHDANISFTARRTTPGGTIKGNLTFNDNDARVKIKQATITTFYLTASNTAYAAGTAQCTVGATTSTCPFTITVVDNGDHGDCQPHLDTVTLTYNTTTVGGRLEDGRVEVSPETGGSGYSAKQSVTPAAKQATATAATPVDATPVTAALSGGFSASLLGVTLSGGRCATAALAYTDGTAYGDTTCRLLGLLGIDIDLDVHLTGATIATGGNTTVTGAATVTVAGLLPVTLPATEVLTTSGTTGLQLTVGGVTLPTLPIATGAIQIG